jgi:biotin synthase
MIDLDQLTSRILKGGSITPQEAVALPSCDFYDLLHAANKIRRHFKGENVNFCSIVNAKSGVCSENCSFCAQSGHHRTSTPVYPMVTAETIMDHFKAATAAGARCFGIVTSGRRLAPEDVATVCAAVEKMKDPSVRLAASLGEIDEASLRRLKESGVARFHHNLETAESFFSNICTSHRYQDRVRTVRTAKSLGLEVCCGGIFGLGESRAQRVEFAFTLKDLDVDSIPMNFLNPVQGTPLERQQPLDGREMLRTIALFRFVLPSKEIGICGGREANLRDLQSWVFYAGANRIMVGGYLTTGGRRVEDDRQMIKDLGLNF